MANNFLLAPPGRCYVDSGLCELGINDWTAIVTTVGEALVSEFLKTGGNIISTGAECTMRLAAAQAKLATDKAAAVVNKGRAVVNAAKAAKQAISDGVTISKQIAKKLTQLKSVFDKGHLVPFTGIFG